MMNELVRLGMNFEKFSPCSILNVFRFKNNGDMVLDIGYNESRMEKVL